MGREDVERALRAMDDDEVRERLSQGDFEAAGDLNLTDQERTLVRDAAGDYPDVAGFLFEVFSTEYIARHIRLGFSQRVTTAATPGDGGARPRGRWARRREMGHVLIKGFWTYIILTLLGPPSESMAQSVQVIAPRWRCRRLVMRKRGIVP